MTLNIIALISIIATGGLMVFHQREGNQMPWTLGWCLYIIVLMRNLESLLR